MNDSTIILCPLCNTQLRVRLQGEEEVNVRCPKCDYAFPFSANAGPFSKNMGSATAAGASSKPQNNSNRAEPKDLVHASQPVGHHHAASGNASSGDAARTIPQAPTLESPIAPGDDLTIPESRRLRGRMKTGKSISIGLALGVVAASLVFLLVGGILIKSYLEKNSPFPVMAANSAPTHEQIIKQLNIQTHSLTKTLTSIKNSNTRDQALPDLRNLADNSERLLIDASSLPSLDEKAHRALGGRLQSIQAATQELDQARASFQAKPDFLEGDVGKVLDREASNRSAIELHLRGLMQLPTPSTKAENALAAQIEHQRKAAICLGECLQHSDNQDRLVATIATLGELADSLNAKAEAYGSTGTKRPKRIEAQEEFVLAEQGIEALLSLQMKLVLEKFAPQHDIDLVLDDFQSMVARCHEAAGEALVNRIGLNASARVDVLSKRRKGLAVANVPKTRDDFEKRWSQPEELIPALPALPRMGGISSAPMAPVDPSDVSETSREEVDPPANPPAGDAVFVPEKGVFEGALRRGGKGPMSVGIINTVSGRENSPENKAPSEAMADSESGPGMVPAPGTNEEGAAVEGMPANGAPSLANPYSDSTELGGNKNAVSGPMMPPKSNGTTKNRPGKNNSKSNPPSKKTQKKSDRKLDPGYGLQVQERVILLVQPITGLDLAKIMYRLETELKTTVRLQTAGDRIAVAVIYSGPMSTVESLIDFGTVVDANPETRTLMIVGKTE